MGQRFSGEHPGMEKSLDESENSSSARRTNPPDNNHADDFNTINTQEGIFCLGFTDFFFDSFIIQNIIQRKKDYHLI